MNLKTPPPLPALYRVNKYTPLPVIQAGILAIWGNLGLFFIAFYFNKVILILSKVLRTLSIRDTLPVIIIEDLDIRKAKIEVKTEILKLL